MPAVRLDLDAARARELGRRARGDDLPPRRIATRSHTSSTSDSRCEFSSTETPRAAQLLEQLAHRPAAHGVERARRLVEQEQPRRSDQRLRDPEPLLHPLRHRLDAAARASLSPTSSSSSVALGLAAPDPASR